MLLAWEQHHLDQAVADIFGFHALQLGLPELDALRANRMPHRWLATEDLQVGADSRVPEASAPSPLEPPPPPSLRSAALYCNFDALPFDSASLDLVVLPHTLEVARDPHLALREVERVLMPEGRVVIVGFNPTSLWGARQRVERWRRRAARGSGGDDFACATGSIAYRRLRDWLRLLSFEVEAGQYGCFLPPFASAKWLQRFGWMERAGDRWWPVLGSLYVIGAVKRVRGMRLVGMLREPRLKPVSVAAPVAARQHGRHGRHLQDRSTGDPDAG